MTPHQLLAEWSQWFWPAFANHLWQATFFAFLVWGAVKMFDQAPARLRYFLWLSALTKFLIPSTLLAWLIGQAGFDLEAPVETVHSATRAAASGMTWFYTETRIILLSTQPASPVEQTLLTNETPVATTMNYHAEFFCALTIVWLLGAGALIARWLMRRWRFARSVRSARIITSGRGFDSLKRARSWMFVNREIALVAPSQVREPGVWRVRRPVIVLPEGVTDRLSDEEIEAVMMHELVHVIHRDNLIGALQLIFCSLLWFHPLAWLIDRRLLAEREMWCDETVIRLSGKPKLYANSLWKVAQIGLGWPVAGVSRAAGSNLKRRIERMLTSNNQFETTIARRAAAYASFFVLAFLAVAVGLFGGDSAFAQRNKIEATTQKGVAEGVKGGVPGGVSSGVRGGVPGGYEGSAHAVTQPGNPTAAVTQEPGSQTKDKQTRRRARPLILYREKAQYTQEAKDNKVEGTVVLSVVFGADSQIKNIQVVRGLPHGLTEKAVEAAKKIRFEPAMKDDQPVSVRGKLEYSFRL